MTSHGFPNQFFTGFTQGAFAANVTAMYDQQATHISYLIKETIARGAKVVEASQAAQDGWGKTIGLLQPTFKRRPDLCALCDLCGSVVRFAS